MLRSIFEGANSKAFLNSINACKTFEQLRETLISLRVPTIGIDVIRNEIDTGVSYLSNYIVETKDSDNYKALFDYMALLQINERGEPVSSEVRGLHELMFQMISGEPDGSSLLEAAKLYTSIDEYPQYLKHLADRLVEERTWASVHLSQLDSDLPAKIDNLIQRWDLMQYRTSPFNGMTCPFVAEALSQDDFRIGVIFGKSDKLEFIDEKTLILSSCLAPIQFFAKLMPLGQYDLKPDSWRVLKAKSEFECPWFFDIDEQPFLNLHIEKWQLTEAEKETARNELAAEKETEKRHKALANMGLSFLSFCLSALLLGTSPFWVWSGALLQGMGMVMLLTAVASCLVFFQRSRELDSSIKFWADISEMRNIPKEIWKDL